jgi:predicted dithiol-disulfide oxidoreductase (DUF899 family)
MAEESMMDHPKVVSRDEWVDARKKLLVEEKAATRARDALNAERRRLPMVKIEKEYIFEGPAGKATLLDLFEGRQQLIIQHFMFDPSWDEGCPSCSFMTDNIGHLGHLHARGTSFAVVSRAQLARIEPFKARMGWTVPWYSSYGSDFNYDFHVTLDDAIAPAEYNYRTKAELEEAGTPWFARGEQPGVSAFLREGDSIFHTYSAFGRGGEQLLNTYMFLDLTALGRQEDEETIAWVRHHDKYDS